MLTVSDWTQPEASLDWKYRYGDDVNEFAIKAREYLLKKEHTGKSQSAIVSGPEKPPVKEPTVKKKAQNSMYETLSRYIIGPRSSKISSPAISPRASPLLEIGNKQKVTELWLGESAVKVDDKL